MAVIDEVLGFYQTMAFEKHINLVKNTGNDLMVMADKNMVRTVLRNLVSNALKYTAPDGVVDVGARLLNDKAEVYVTDNGLGMKTEMVERLFKLDQTFSTLGTADEKGTGLGLILCKEFVEKNRGTLAIESELGMGSTFRFTLPLSQ